tara:strand:+ start:282 stop:1127 length:846 start_codon:yes stop_codon:yes gene_type:complete
MHKKIARRALAPTQMTEGPSPFHIARFITRCFFKLAIFLGVAVIALGDDYERLESATKRWLDLEQRIAEEHNAWKSQRKVLSQSIKVLEASIGELTEVLENLKVSAEKRSSEFAKNEHTYEDQEVARAYYAGKLDELTELFLRFRAFVPDYLEEEMNTAQEKLEMADPIALGARAQILIAAFTRVEEFNRSVTMDYVSRELADGRDVMVSVLYWGLARAYAVDPQGTIAWELKPGLEGWVWHERPEYIQQIHELVQIHGQTRPPSIQSVPGEVFHELGGEK